jgi:hypothetical protein
MLKRFPVTLVDSSSYPTDLRSSRFSHHRERHVERSGHCGAVNCDTESTMKVALRVIGVLFLVMGLIWFLQGANVLTAGNSPMIGDTRWEFYGGLAALIGVALLVLSWRKTSSSRQ